jgi:hypothetical protein
VAEAFELIRTNYYKALYFAGEPVPLPRTLKVPSRGPAEGRIRGDVD